MGDPTDQEYMESATVEVQSRSRDDGSGDLCRAALQAVQGNDLTIDGLAYWVRPAWPVSSVRVADSQRRECHAGRVRVTRRVVPTP